MMITFDDSIVLTSHARGPCFGDMHRWMKLCNNVSEISGKMSQSRNKTLHGSVVSRESDLRSVPYTRPVGVRSFVKNVKSLSENQHNS